MLSSSSAGLLASQCPGRQTAGAAARVAAQPVRPNTCSQWTQPARGETLTCRAHPRRVAKVSSQIQREISEMFIRDKVVQAAICPERRQGLDDKLSAVASITHVYVSNDLQVVKVYVSVYSDELGKQRAIDNLKRIAPYVRSRIGAAVRLRLTPEIRFEYDDALDELERIQQAIGQEDFDRYLAEADAEARGLAGPGSGGASSSSGGGARGDGEGEGKEEEEQEEEAGFFDIPDADAESSAAAGGALPSRGVAWSRHDPATFFAVDADEGEEEEGAGGAWYARAGPFDDLFTGSGSDLVQEQQAAGQQQQQQQQQRTRRGKGKGRQAQRAG